jgi:hypothetical protein
MRSHLPLSILRTAAALGCLTGAGLLTAAGCSDAGSPVVDPPEGPVGQAAQAASTCVTLTRAGGASVADAQIANRSPYNSNFGASASMLTGYAGTPESERQSLVRFDLSSIPSGSVVTSAKVTLYATTNTTANVRVHRVTAPWSESTVSWQSFAGAYDSTVAATFSSGPAQVFSNPAAAPAYAQTFDITGLAQSWVNGTSGNYGVLLEQPLVSGVFTFYRTSEWSPTSYQPSMTICYGAGAANGTACAQASDCASGFCADGVCCDAACTGTCVACTAAKKGSGSDGTCGPIAYQTDPDAECPRTLYGMSCGSNGQGCDGNGACIVYPAGTFCGQGACFGSQGVKSQCDGLGHCVTTVAYDCGAYACFYPGCKTYCTSNYDCSAGHACDTNTGICY